MIGRHSDSDPAGASRRYENPAAPTNETIRHGGAAVERRGAQSVADRSVTLEQ